MQRLKKAAVESYVGAIGIGWILAQAVLHFAYVFAAPVSQWIARREYCELMNQPSPPARLYVYYAMPELIRCVLLLIVGYVLLRWLYFKPVMGLEES